MPEPHPQMSPEQGTAIGARGARWLDDSGQDLVEYALLGLLIAVALIGVVTLFGGQLATVYGSLTAALSGGS